MIERKVDNPIRTRGATPESVQVLDRSREYLGATCRERSGFVW